MNTPTNDDLKRMVDEQWPEEVRHSELGSSPDGLGKRALLLVATAFAVMAKGGAWRDVRIMFVSAARLCLLAAWEAGERVAPQDPPTVAETPKAKGAPHGFGADALLEEMARRMTVPHREFTPDPKTLPEFGAFRLAMHLAAALRAERERADSATKCADWRYDYWWHATKHIGALLGWVKVDQYSQHGISAAQRFLEKCSPSSSDEPCRDPSTAIDLAAKLAAEDEAHGYTRADLAKTKRELDGAIRDRNAAVDQTTAYRAENQTLGMAKLELTHRVEQLEKGIATERGLRLQEREQRERLELAIEGLNRLVNENAKGRA